jgi:putative nucleotidyltransferase with HDIG domain
VSAILVVDDEVGIRELVALSLAELGYDVSEAAGAADALAQLEARPFGVVLSDVHMPGLDGVTLAAEIRARYPDTVVIMLTGDDDPPVIVGSMRAGAIDYLVKPVPRMVLAHAVDRGLLWHVEARKERRARAAADRLLARRQHAIAHALADLDLASTSSIEALLRVLTLHDPAGYGHATRVAASAEALAGRMGLTLAPVQAIRHAALLHDIGKVAIGPAVLHKPAALDSCEIELIRRHPERGFEVLRSVPFLKESAEIVRAHHEHFDGCGYARGLSGDAIPIGARIVAVSDTFDALTHERPYRGAASREAAVREIHRCRGRQFDPAVVDAFVNSPAP